MDVGYLLTCKLLLSRSSVISGETSNLEYPIVGIKRGNEGLYLEANLVRV